MKNSHLFPVMCILLSASACTSIFASTSYAITILGLTDIEHTRDDNFRNGGVKSFTEIGNAVSFVQRYNGTSSDLGVSAWLYNGTSTKNIGLTDDVSATHPLTPSVVPVTATVWLYGSCLLGLIAIAKRKKI